jgi:D-glycero-D-manno-heptose 1,7-bisphosphate phosphatase
MIIDGHSVYIRPGFIPQKTWAVFFDRDGVINVEKEFVFKIEDFELIPQIIPAIQKLNEAQVPVIVVHNAAAVARNICRLDQVEAFNQHLLQELSTSNAIIDAIFLCPHHFDAFNTDYKKDCDWRKPRPGMLEAAARQFHLDLSQSHVIGDHERDVAAAHAAGAKGVLVKYGDEILAAIDEILP